MGVIDHDENHHNYKQETTLHHFGTDVQSSSNNFNAGHHSNGLAIDPSVADTVSVPMTKTDLQQHQMHEPVINNAVAPGPLAASQTAYGAPNSQTNWVQSVSSHQVNRDTANAQVYGNNLNMFAAAQGSTTGINEFNNQLTGTSPAVNAIATQTAMSDATLDNHPSSETLLDSTGGQSLPNANSLSGGIIPLHGDTEMLTNAQTKSETGAHLMNSKPIASDHNSIQSALTMNHDIANGDTTSVANIHAAPEQPEIGQEIHHFVADSNDNELHEINNLPLQFFSQGHKVTTVGDHASLEADHGIVEAGLSDAHHNHHIFDSLHEHNQEEESVEHVMPSTGAIHVTEDSHGQVHKHINDWNEAEHNGLHDLHVEESHNKEPYAIHVSDNGHGYAVQAEEYHDHEDGHVENGMENDLNHVAGLDHTDHVISNHGMMTHENTDQGIIDHGIIDHEISNHEYIQHGTADHGIIDHGIIDHGITDHGSIDHDIGDHGIIDHQVTDHEITEHGSIDHDIGDHAITDAVADVDAIDDREAILHQTNHAAVEIGHSDEEIIDHAVPVQHEANDHHTIVSQEIHDPGIHVNFHAMEHGQEFYDGVDNPEHSEMHINSPIPINSHGHEEITHTVGEPVAESHATTSVTYEHLHEEPHIELHHDDHRDYHDGGIAPELVETNIHSNSVPEYNGNNPMTYLHDVTGHETGHDVRHDIHEIATHDTLNAGMHTALHDGMPGEIHAGFHDVNHHVVHQNLPLTSHEFATAEHSAEEHAHASNMINEQVHASHDLGVHGFDEHGEEFLINREVQHHGEHIAARAQSDDANPVDRSEENQVHLDEKDAELLKKAKENEIIDPPYLTHLDPHGDGFGEGVVGGPDLNVGNSLQTSAAVSSTFPATIPNSPPFVGNHPATMVQNGNIAPDYGSKRQKFEHEKNQQAKSGYVSIGDPKKGDTGANKIAGNAGIIGKMGATKPKLSKFIKGRNKDSMSFFANDREKKAEQIFETIPNEPRILSNTDKNKEERKENSQDSTKVTSLGVQKEKEHNITNGVSSNVGNKEEEEENGTRVETAGKDKEKSTDLEDNKDRNSKNFGGKIDSSIQNSTESKNDKEKEDKNAESSNENKAKEAEKINEKKKEETLQNSQKVKSENKSGNKTTQENKVKTKNETNVEEGGQNQAPMNNETETSLTTTKIKQNLVGSNENKDSFENAKHGIEEKTKTEEMKDKDGKLESKDTKHNDKKSTEKKTAKGQGRKDKSRNSRLNENSEEESTKEKVKMEKDTKSVEHIEDETKVSGEKLEKVEARDYASGSGEGSDEDDKGKGKKVTANIESKNEGGTAKSSNESVKTQLKKKEKNKNDENLERYKDNSTQNDSEQGAKERTKFSDSKKVNETKENEKKGVNDKNLNKSKSKGKKGDKSRNENKENETLGSDKGTEENAENKAQDKLREEITEKNSTSSTAAENARKNITESRKLTGGDRKKMEGFMADSSARQPRVKYTQKQSTPTQRFEKQTSNNDKYSLHGGPENGNGYTNEEEKSSKDDSGNGEMQEVDDEGRTIERSKDGEGKETTTQESSGESGFEKVGPQKNASRRTDDKDAAKSEEEINVSVDKEEWKSNEENSEGKQSGTEEQESKEMYTNEEKHGIGGSSNGLMTTEQDDLAQETGPTESPTQFYLSDKSEGSGNTETPTDFVSTQSDAAQSDTAQAPAEKNSREVDVITNSGKTYARENEESAGVGDPIDIIEANTATVHNTKNAALEEKELFGGDSGNEATYSSLEDKRNIRRQKPTDALIRKRHQLPRHRNNKEAGKQGSKNRKQNLSTRLKAKRSKRYIERTDRSSMISNTKITERKRTRRRAYLYDIFRRGLLIRRTLKGYKR